MTAQLPRGAWSVDSAVVGHGGPWSRALRSRARGAPRRLLAPPRTCASRTQPTPKMVSATLLAITPVLWRGARAPVAAREPLSARASPQNGSRSPPLSHSPSPPSLPSLQSEAEVQALVVDNGSGMCKAGFAGGALPRLCFPPLSCRCRFRFACARAVPPLATKPRAASSRRRRAARRVPVHRRPAEAPGHHGRHGPEGRLRRRRGAVQARRALCHVARAVALPRVRRARAPLNRSPPPPSFAQVLALKYPIESGIVVNWDDMEKIWHHTCVIPVFLGPQHALCLRPRSAASAPLPPRRAASTTSCAWRPRSTRCC